MRKITVDNPVLDSYITDISSDYSSGTAVTVRNNNSFAANDLGVFGSPKDELTELKKIDSIAGSVTLNIASALNFAHGKGTQVYRSLWDFIEIEGRSSSAGVFALLTQSGIQWDNSKGKTIYFHSAGDDNWEYRFRFYNSVTTTYSEYSPTLSGLGFIKDQVGYLIKEARRVAGDHEGRIMTIDELIRSLVRAKNIIRAHNPRYWFWKVNGAQSSKTIAATAGNSVYSLSLITDLGVMDTIEYRYTSGATDLRYMLRRFADAEFLVYTRDQNRPDDDYPRLYRLLPADASSSKGYFEIENGILTSNVGTFYINYYKEETDYNSVDDTTDLVFPEILVDYLAAEIYATRGNQAQADKYYEMFTGPQGRQKTLPLRNLTGIALLDELDRQYKTAQGQPRSIWRFRGQKAVPRLYGSRSIASSDHIREHYFDGYE